MFKTPDMKVSLVFANEAKRFVSVLIKGTNNVFQVKLHFVKKLISGPSIERNCQQQLEQRVNSIFQYAV